jgi:hypothetical protein
MCAAGAPRQTYADVLAFMHVLGLLALGPRHVLERLVSHGVIRHAA